ncbi:MAG: hypothetical protein QXI43_06310 [Candidatus Nitrosocaldus sp.]
MLIMDEAHAIEDMVVSFFTITIGRNKAKRLGIVVSTFDSIVNSDSSMNNNSISNSSSSKNSSSSNGNSSNSDSISSNNSSSNSNSSSSSNKTLPLLALGLLSNYLQACEVEREGYVREEEEEGDRRNDRRGREGGEGK